MPRGKPYSTEDDALILRADRPRAAHIADAARLLDRTPDAIRKRAQRLRGGGGVAGSQDNDGAQARRDEAEAGA